MKKSKKILLVAVLSIIILIIAITIIRIISDNNSKTESNENHEINEDTFKQESIMYKEDADINELKEEYKMTGEDDLYEINIESDGRKVLNIKTEKNCKVAFAGMIKKEKPSFEEIDDIYSNEFPTNSGIWINKEDRKEIIEYLDNSNQFNAKYKINEDGYLETEEENNLTKSDKTLIESIKSDNQYILSISSAYYMIDVVTGEIVDNPYNELEEYQTYEYVEDNNKFIIFISESKKMGKEEKFLDILNLMEILNKQ